MTPGVIKKTLAFALKSGENGFGDAITNITDKQGQEPSEANGWLWNGRSFEGLLVSGTQVFDFTITKTGDGWVSEITPRSGVK